MRLTHVPAREQIESLYPRHFFEAEAAANSTARVTVLRGLRVERMSGPGGTLRIVRASHHVGGAAKSRRSVFVCPYMGRRYALFSLARGVHGPVIENADPFEHYPEEYDAFVARVLATAEHMITVEILPPGRSPGAAQPLKP